MKYKNKLKGKYRSVLEDNIAKFLINNNIEFEYEPIKFVLQESLEFPSWEKNKKNNFTEVKKKREISYTPDFVGKDWIIEGKGFRTPDFNIKWKLFQKQLKEKNLNYKIFLIQRLKDLEIFKKVINNEYAEEVHDKRNRSTGRRSSKPVAEENRRNQKLKRIPRVHRVLY